MGQDTGSYQTWRNDNSFGTDLVRNEPSLRKIWVIINEILSGWWTTTVRPLFPSPAHHQDAFKGVYRVLEGKAPTQEITHFTTLKIFTWVAISQLNANSGWNFLQRHLGGMAFLTLLLWWGHFSSRDLKLCLDPFFPTFSEAYTRAAHTCTHRLVGGTKLSKCSLPWGNTEAWHYLIWIALRVLDDRTFAGYKINQSCCLALRQDIWGILRDRTTITN